MSSATFEQALVESLSFLHGAAMTLAQNKEAAKDLVQQTLLSALKNQQTFVSGTNLRAWLFTILRNRFRSDHQQKQRRRQLMRQPLSALSWQAVAEENGGPGKMTMDTIAFELKALPFTYRQVLTLRMRGYRYAEISAVIEEPVGTVKSRIHAGRQLLRGRLFDLRGF